MTTPLEDASTPVADLRARVAAMVAARDWARFHSPKNLAMNIACEAAELMEHFLWADDAGSTATVADPSKRDAITAEIADVAIALLNLCNVAGVDLSAAVERKLVEIDAKYPADRARGRADKYTAYE